MDKKDIYEHLAKIYLDASSKRKKKPKDSKLFKNLFIAGIAFVFVLSASAVFYLKRSNNPNTEIALVIAPDAVKINFHFDPAKREIYNVSLNNLNLSRYKALAFAIKQAGYKDDMSVRIEFATGFKEKSEIYLKNIPHKWKEFRINLSQFKGINDWSAMSELSFIVEEWNAREKKGVVYVDNVRFVR